MGNYMTKTGATHLIGRIKTDLAGKAATDLSNVTNAKFLEKAQSAGAAGSLVTASSSDGVAYTATVPGLTSLSAGVEITIIPAKVSASATPTLNVNSLGAKYIRMLTGYNTTTTTTGAVASWLAANKPVKVRYDGTYWIADLQRASANALSGTVKIENGGTGATTAAAALKGLGGMVTTFISIPAGRMKGDVDGDGRITDTDRQLIADHASEETLITDATALQCADIDGDGEVGLGDRQAAARISAGTLGAGYGGDILGNWTVNPNYATEVGQFYKDFTISGMEAGNPAVVLIQGTADNGNYSAECMSGKLRLYARLCPIEAATAAVMFGSGSGSVICVG